MIGAGKIWPLLAVLFILGSILSLALGSVSINWIQVFGSTGLSPTEHTILYDLRLPRMLAAIFGGGALSLAGLFMQTLFRNPLAGPSVLGISSGSSLAVALLTLGSSSIVIHSFTLVTFAILGALGVLAIITWVANRFHDISSVLIVGIMLSFFTSAIVGVLQAHSSDQSLKAFIIWGFGSFGTLRFTDIPVFILPISVIILTAPLLSKKLNGYMLGSEHAQSLGINVSQLRLLTILASGILVAVVTAFCGPIAFIGLAAPHIARMLFRTSDHHIIMPASVIMGSLLGLFCDIIARLPGSAYALPLNTVCAFIGAPIVIYLLVRQRKFSMRW